MKKTLLLQSFSNCKGCLLLTKMSLDDYFKIQQFFDIQENIEHNQNIDVAIIEGSPNTDGEAKLLRNIRKHAKTIITVGACTNQKSYFTNRKKLIKDYIKVDIEIFGCPINPKELFTALMDSYWGKVYTNQSLSVCSECKQNQNYCRIKNNQSCLGPITRSGCNSACINYNGECVGCRGNIAEPNILKNQEIISHLLSPEELLDLNNLFNDKSNKSGVHGYKLEPYRSSRTDAVNSFAHNIVSTLALEKALGIRVSQNISKIRELLIITEIFRNHCWILYENILPKLLGVNDYYEIKKNHLEIAEKFELLLNQSNSILSSISGNKIHPITNIVGGLTFAPEGKEFQIIAKNLAKTTEITKEIIKLFLLFETEMSTKNTVFYSIHGSKFTDQEIWGSNGHVVKTEEYQSISSKKSSVFGAIARIFTNKKYQSKDTLLLLEDERISTQINRHHNKNLARAIELFEIITRIKTICTELSRARIDLTIQLPKKTGRGVAVSEFSEGLIINDYIVDKNYFISKSENKKLPTFKI